MEGAGRISRIASPVAVAISVFVILGYVVRAAVVVRYPFDWLPDEGLAFDCARRLLTTPELVYGKSVCPFPCIHTPLLAALMAPIVAATPAPFLAARLLALAWTLGAALAVGWLVRAVGGRALAVSAAALALGQFDMTFWLPLVRVDGLMLSLWIAAAIPLMPRALVRGADRLDGRRLAAGTVLLLAAGLTKITAAVHGAPLVLAWFLVDRRSALRLAAALAAPTVAIVLVLQWMTGGGFLWVMRLWAIHDHVPGQVGTIVAFYASHTLPVWIVVAVGFGLAWRAGARPWRDGSIVLLLGGLAAVPALAKSGAMWNYLLPLLFAGAVAAGRFWAAAGPRAAAVAPVVLAVVAFGQAITRPFPLPTPADEQTSRLFYGYVEQVARERGRPILAAWPAYASFVAGQPEEIEPTILPFFVGAQVNGVEEIRERLRSGYYPLVIDGPFFPPAGFEAALAEGYERFGGCDVPFFFGRMRHSFFAPRGKAPIPFDPPAGSGCGRLPP